jgi:hypothetical protein
MSKDSSSLSNEITSKLDMAKGTLESMKQKSEADFPFLITSEMESIIDIIENCFDLMKECLGLLEKLEKLNAYNSKSDFTKIMLLLTNYGSEKALLKRAHRHIVALSERLKDLEDNLARTQSDLINSESITCAKCKGTGKLLKRTYIRERGTFPQAVLKSVPCNICNGVGKIRLSSKSREVFSNFSNIAKNISVELKTCHEKLNDFVINYELGRFKG